MDTASTIRHLEDFIALEKFLPDNRIHYPGLGAKELKSTLTELVNEAARDFIKIALYNPSEENYQNIISLWKLLNEQIIRVIRKIPQEKLNNTCKTPEEHSIIWLIEDYIKHLNHHLNQILN